jgi:hypothetical protein
MLLVTSSGEPEIVAVGDNDNSPIDCTGKTLETAMPGVAKRGSGADVVRAGSGTISWLGKSLAYGVAVKSTGTAAVENVRGTIGSLSPAG